MLPGRYTFDTGTAEFLFCSRCGVTVTALCESSGSLKAVLNINTLDDAHVLDFEHSDSDFEGESLEQRLGRRTANWIGQVSLN
jgi:hypothetical protein